jgi:hypothetical protein
MDYENDDWIKKLLEPLRTENSEIFVQNVMRRVRTYDHRQGGILWSHLIRWALPALALSVSGFAAAMIYTVVPDHVSTDALLLADRDQSMSADWLSNPPSVDQILDSVIVKE